jgi:hypothetical protein
VQPLLQRRQAEERAVVVAAVVLAAEAELADPEAVHLRARAELAGRLQRLRRRLLRCRTDSIQPERRLRSLGAN